MKVSPVARGRAPVAAASVLLSCGLCLFISFPAHAGFCNRLMLQTAGYDLFGGDEEAMDREKLADEAIAEGIQYLALKVPISQLADILGNPYLPKQYTDGALVPQLLEPIGPSKAGQDISVRLGGLNILLHSDMLDPTGGSAAARRIEPNPNHNAFLLYSPRIFSLSAWTYGNKGLIQNPQSTCTPGQLSAGWSCVTSNSSNTFRRRAFEMMADSDETPWMVRADGLLPRYEILGILTQKQNEHYINAVLDRYPGLKGWKDKLIFKSTFPVINPASRIYSPQELYEVALDINPSVLRRESAQEDISNYILSSAVLGFTPEFPAMVRGLVSSRVLPNLDRALHERSDYGWSGYSQYNVQMMTEMERVLSEGGTTDEHRVPRLLPDAKLHKVGRIKIHAIRTWEFILAEYEGQNEASRLVLFVRNDGEEEPPADVPYRVWGIAERTADNLEWVWTP